MLHHWCQSWSQAAVVTSEGWAPDGGQPVKQGRCSCVCVCLNEKPEHAALGREAVERGKCKRVINDLTSWRREGWIQRSSF